MAGAAWLAVTACALGVGGHPAAAEDPQTPEAVAPVAAVLSPVIDEVSPCGNISVALVAADLALRGVTDAVGGAAPPQVSQLVVLVYARALLTLFSLDSSPCALIPPRQLRTRCGVDDQVGSAVAGLPVPSGLPLPVDPVGLLPVRTDPAPVGAFVDVLAALAHLAAPDTDLVASLAGPLDCKTTRRVTAAPSLGSGGGGVDLNRRSADASAGPNPTAGGQRTGGAATRVLGSRDADNDVRAETALDASPSAVASPQDVAATARRGEGRKHDVYLALALLTGGAAAWGFISPRRKPTRQG